MKDHSDGARAAIPGSARDLPPGANEVDPVDGAERALVTIVLRSRPEQAGTATPSTFESASPAPRPYLTRSAFAQSYGALADDIDAVTRFAQANDLAVRDVSDARRSVVVEGTLAALERAFGTRMLRYRALDGTFFRGRTGPLFIPAELNAIVVGVFGLDDREQAHAQYRLAIKPALGRTTVSYTPVAIAQGYAFPAGDGAGQTIALIELGGGYTQADLDRYFGGLALATPRVTIIPVDGGSNAPTGNPQSADSEVLLDIDVAGAIAPAAHIVVYFAPNTDQGFLDAITTAIHDDVNRPQTISISWGGPETRWTGQALTAFDRAFADAALLGVTVMCAAGDNGSGDNVGDGLAHVDFPASSPHVLACGGTRLILDATGIASETVWNDAPAPGATGGGISDRFDLPTWQAGANVPPSANAGARVGRGVPDVAGDADPQTGYAIFVDGSASVVGGTSAVAPLWAALVARLNARRTQPLGFLNPLLYANPAVLHDILDGDNGAYRARAGWDPCTGLGSPDGARLAALLDGKVGP